MNVINQIATTLSKEELRYFKIYANRMEASVQRKDLKLLDYLRQKGEKFDDDKIATKLYGNSDKSAYYRLKSRLLDYLGDFLVIHHTWKSEANELNRHLALYNIFLQKRQFKVALFYLKKAQEKAMSIDNIEVLDIIYSHYIKLSSELLEINPEEYITKRKENATQLNKLREMDQALAALTYRLKITQNVRGEKTNALKILNATIKEYAGASDFKNSKTFQTSIYRAVSQVLLQQHNYTALEIILKEWYQRFETEKWFTKENHETKLQMLTYLVNSLFRNGKFDESLKYAEKLGGEIKAFNSLLYDKYLFFYYNSLVINYTATDKKKALQTVEEFEAETKNKKNSYYDQFVHLNKAILLHQLGKPVDAIRNLVKLYVNDNYKRADDSMKLKISMTELMMQFDAGDPESYNIRSAAIKKQFKNLLTEGDFSRENDLIRIVDKMNSDPQHKNNETLKKQATSFVKAKLRADIADTEIIRYSPWLASKWKIGVTT